jgi:GAF domain-containing protein
MDRLKRCFPQRRIDRMSGEAKKSKEEIMRLNQELSTLNAISQTVNQSTDLDEILNKSLDKMMEMIDVSSAGVYLLDEKDRDLVYVAHRGFSKASLKEMKRIRLGEGVTGKAAFSGEAVFVEDYSSHPEALTLAIEEGVKSLVVIPLKSRGKIYGTLNVTKKEIWKLTLFEKNLFNSIGQIISGAMERTSLYTENVKRLEELKTLYSISQEIASKLELKVILQKIMESAVELLGAESGTVALWDNRKQNYAIAIAHRLPDSLCGKEFSPPWSGVVGEVIAKKSPVLYKDYEHHRNDGDRIF